MFHVIRPREYHGYRIGAAWVEVHLLPEEVTRFVEELGGEVQTFQRRVFDEEVSEK